MILVNQFLCDMNVRGVCGATPLGLWCHATGSEEGNSESPCAISYMSSVKVLSTFSPRSRFARIVPKQQIVDSTLQGYVDTRTPVLTVAQGGGRTMLDQNSIPLYLANRFLIRGRVDVQGRKGLPNLRAFEANGKMELEGRCPPLIAFVIGTKAEPQPTNGVLSI